MKAKDFVDVVKDMTDEELDALKKAIAQVEKQRAVKVEKLEEKEPNYPTWGDGSSMY